MGAKFYALIQKLCTRKVDAEDCRPSDNFSRKVAISSEICQRLYPSKLPGVRLSKSTLFFILDTEQKLYFGILGITNPNNSWVYNTQVLIPLKMRIIFPSHVAQFFVL